jgi:hypothetical protein
MTVTLLWKCNKLIVTQLELLRYYRNAVKDLTCHNIQQVLGRLKSVMMFRIVFWDVLPCKMIVDRRFRGAYWLHHPRRQFWTSYSPPWELEISLKSVNFGNKRQQYRPSYTQRHRPSHLYAATSNQVQRKIINNAVSSTIHFAVLTINPAVA